MLILTIFRFFSLASSALPMPFPHDPGFLFGKFFACPSLLRPWLSHPYLCLLFTFVLREAKNSKLLNWSGSQVEVLVHLTLKNLLFDNLFVHLTFKQKPLILHIKTFYLSTWNLQNPLIWQILQESSSPLDLATAEEMETDQLMKWAIKLPFVFHLFFLPSPSRNI